MQTKEAIGGKKPRQATGQIKKYKQMKSKCSQKNTQKSTVS